MDSNLPLSNILFKIIVKQTEMDPKIKVFLENIFHINTKTYFRRVVLQRLIISLLEISLLQDSTSIKTR